MLPRPSRCLDIFWSKRSLFAWILAAGTLFTAAATLRHISIVIEGSIFTRERAENPWMKSDFRGPSCQQLSRPSAVSNNSLDVLAKVYVISLPRRTDRRLQMDRLKDALHLNWTYRNACEADASVVTTILHQVHVLRSQLGSRPQPDDVHVKPHDAASAFDWPHDLEDTIHCQEALQLSGADLWTLPSSHGWSDSAVLPEMADPYAFTRTPAAQVPVVSDPKPLACTSGNNVSAAFSPKLPLHRRLTAAKVACWYSHFQAIRDVANGKDEVTLVLEDDVDIERDVKRRLQALLDALPGAWDIVYLGHCWSNESQVSPLRSVSLRLPNGRTTLSGLYPASSPKCTHAYLLSRIGARRIVAHLRHPPFAYSRAIDQALAWLVQSGRLRAFSIVPPVVVQRKIVLSDVVPGLGSAWRDELYDGVFGNLDEQ